MEWVKIAHIVAMVAWMAGLFYLPRLFVYHCQATRGGEADRLLQIMERRLYRAIMMPAMVATWVFGIVLAWMGGLIEDGVPAWLAMKVAVVIGLSGFHFMLDRYRVEFAEERNSRGERYYRLINEVPTVALVVIVALVILQPW